MRLQSKMLCCVSFVLFFAIAALAAPKSASAYYSDAAFQYIENRLPSAEITCNEGLQYYPNDQKLQMLLDRIQEAKDEQKNENKKNDKNQDNQDQNQDQQNQENQEQNQNGDSSSSQSEEQENQNQEENQNGQSSSSSEQSSDSNDGANQQPEASQEPEENSSNSQEEQPQEMPTQIGEMTPEEASQLLKDFDEQNGERKPWKPVRGQTRPAKDW